MGEGFSSFYEGGKGGNPETEAGSENPPKAEDKYDRAYWTPDRIVLTIADFFKKLGEDEERMRKKDRDYWSRRLLRQNPEKRPKRR